MNFFRKKGNIFASLSPSELEQDTDAIRSNLMSLAPFNSGMEVKLNLSETKDIPLIALAAMIAFSGELESHGASLSIQVNQQMKRDLELLNFNEMLHSIEEKEA